MLLPSCSRIRKRTQAGLIFVNILQILPHFPPAPLDFGSGVVHVAYHVSKELAARGHNVTICTSSFADTIGDVRPISGFNNPVVMDGIKVVYFPYSMSYDHFYLTLSLVPYMKKNIGTFDVAHLHDVRCFQSIVTHHYAKEHGLPYVVQIHGSYLGSFDDNKPKWLLDSVFSRKVLKDANRVIALTRTEADYYRRQGITAEKIDIVGNGIDLSRYRQAATRGKFRKKFGIGKEDRVILYVGRLTNTKGLDLLLEATSDLKNRLRALKLVLVGPDFGYASELKRKASDLKIEDCTLFIGPVDETDKIDAYVDADVFVTPSFTGFPLTFLESCACGTPIVTTSNADTLDWIDGKVGYVTAYKKDELAEAIMKIFCDYLTRAEFQANCRTLVEKQFRWSNIVDKIEETYRRAADN
jgi:glycosyltransferase involved in cell wall biosynthesis